MPSDHAGDLPQTISTLAQKLELAIGAEGVEGPGSPLQQILRDLRKFANGW